MGKYVMALDAGTTSNRCMLFDRAGRVVSVAQNEFQQHYPQPGWVEHDAAEIWESMLRAAREAVASAGAQAADIAAVGVANQRETAVVWDKASGEPICRAIVWQCRRTAAYCDELRARGWEAPIREKTGLPLDAYFSGTKLKWILDNVPGARARAARGEILFGTVDSWLIWKLTGGRAHVTDYSNASRTMLYNIRTLAWDEDILRELDIPAAMLPQVLPSSCVYGETQASLFGAPVRIAGAAGDQQAALFGQACFAPGTAKNTYGTGGFLLMHTGAQPTRSAHGLITTIAWGLQAGKVEYALEGSVFVSGALIQWLRDELGLLTSAKDSEYFANTVEDTNGCYIVPAFVGLGAPYWDPYARGCIVGLTRGVGRAHIIRASLEAIAYQTCDVLAAMERDAGVPLRALRVDGGASANDFLMQFQADMTGVPVQRPACVETTALGAAYLAGLAVGYWPDRDAIRENGAVERTFAPRMDAGAREKKLAQWHRAVERARGWAKED